MSEAHTPPKGNNTNTESEKEFVLFFFNDFFGGRVCEICSFWYKDFFDMIFGLNNFQY